MKKRRWYLNSLLATLVVCAGAAQANQMAICVVPGLEIGGHFYWDLVDDLPKDKTGATTTLTFSYAKPKEMEHGQYMVVQHSLVEVKGVNAEGKKFEFYNNNWHFRSEITDATKDLWTLLVDGDREKYVFSCAPATASDAIFPDATPSKKHSKGAD